MCEQDWALEYLNRGFDREGYQIAMHCVAANVSRDLEAEYWVRNRRVLPHARRLEHIRVKAAIDWSEFEPGDLFWVAYLYQ